MKNSSDQKSLYLSYDGALEPLGQSQIIPYLKGLFKKGFKIIFVSFDKSRHFRDKKRKLELKEELQNNGIYWKSLRYHKKPSLLATSFDILQGVLVGIFFVKRRDIKILHARGYVSALVAFILKKLFNLKFIFDMRGLWADEKVGSELWKANGLLFKLTKNFERKFLLAADKVVVLTKRMKKLIQEFDYLQEKKNFVTVIPTCVDMEKFDYYKKMSLVTKQNDILVYSGSLGTVYLLEQMLDFFNNLKSNFKDMKFLLLTPTSEEIVYAALPKRGLSSAQVKIKKVGYDNVPFELCRSKVGIAFYKTDFSVAGRAPTKIGEYLACGIPVVVNAGIGDLDSIIEKERVGVIVKSFSDKSFQKSILELKDLLKEKESLRKRCRMVAKKYFSLRNGVEEYAKIYNELKYT